MFLRVALAGTSAIIVAVIAYSLTIPPNLSWAVLREGNRCAAQGQWESAEWAYRFLLVRCPLSPATPVAAGALLSTPSPDGATPQRLSWPGVAARAWPLLAFPAFPCLSPFALGLLGAFVGIAMALAPGTRQRGAWLTWAAALTLTTALSLALTVGWTPLGRPVAFAVHLYRYHTYGLVGGAVVSILVAWASVLRRPMPRHAAREESDVSDGLSHVPASVGRPPSRSAARQPLPEVCPKAPARSRSVGISLAAGLGLAALVGFWLAAGAPGTARGASRTAMAALDTYWHAVASASYDVSWPMLSDDFRNRNFGGRYDKYVAALEAMRLCNASIVRSERRFVSSDQVHVDAVLRLEAGPTCRASDECLRFEFRKIGGVWQLDRARKIDRVYGKGSSRRAGASS